jgi:FG-GAP-like repeat
MQMSVRRIAAAIVTVSAVAITVVSTAQPASAAVGSSVVDVPYAASPNFNSPLATSADVDGDGRDDVVVAQGASIVVYPGSATSGLAPAVTTPFVAAAAGTGWTRVLAAGDVTGDGAADLVVAEATGSHAMQLVLLRSNGVSGTFGAPTVIFGPVRATAQVSATIGDVEGDDHADIIATLGGGLPGMSWLVHNVGDGTVAPAALLGSTGFSPRLVDIDRDGADELIGWDASVVSGAQLRAFVTDPSVPGVPTSYGELFSAAAGTDGRVVQVVDLTGDEYPDLVTQHGRDGGIARSTGDGGFSTAVPIGFSVSTAGPFDVDDDGDLDPLTFDELGAPRIAVNDGTGAFQLEPLAGVPLGSLIVGDFDGDGRRQLAVLHDTFGPAPTITIVTFATPAV